MAKKKKNTVTVQIKGEERTCEVLEERSDGKLLVRTTDDHPIQRRMIVEPE